MGDFGPTSATTNTGFEPFNADIFKEAKLQQELNDSKDSDEGFSSSFSPTSESSMIQGEAISTSLHLWGNNTEKEDQYFINSLAPVSSNSNGSFLPSSSRRVVQAPSPTQNIKRPSPALCTFLGANKVAAHSLGVSNSNWNHQQPPTQTSSWPMNPPNPIGSNSMASNWNMPAMKNGLPNPPMQQHMNNAQQIAFQLQQQKNMLTKTNGVLPNGGHGHHPGNHPFPPNLIHSKNMKNSNRFPGSHHVPFNTPANIPFSSAGGSNTGHQLSNGNNSNGMESTIGDDIGHLTNSFSSLSTSSEHANVHPTANGFLPNQVCFLLILYFSRFFII
jgi:hypothetical protein